MEIQDIGSRYRAMFIGSGRDFEIFLGPPALRLQNSNGPAGTGPTVVQRDRPGFSTDIGRVQFYGLFSKFRPGTLH